MTSNTTQDLLDSIVDVLPKDYPTLVSQLNTLHQLEDSIFQNEFAIKENLSDNIGDITRYAFGIGDGSSLVVWTSDAYKSALVVIYDHESDFNFYAIDDSFLDQASFFEGIPSEFNACVFNAEETRELLNIYSEDEQDTVATASGVFWLENSQWHINTTYKQEAISIDESGGAKWLLADLVDLNSGSVDEFWHGKEEKVKSFFTNEEDQQAALVQLAELKA